MMTTCFPNAGKSGSIALNTVNIRWRWQSRISSFKKSLTLRMPTRSCRDATRHAGSSTTNQPLSPNYFSPLSDSFSSLEMDLSSTSNRLRLLAWMTKSSRSRLAKSSKV